MVMIRRQRWVLCCQQMLNQDWNGLVSSITDSSKPLINLEDQTVLNLCFHLHFDVFDLYFKRFLIVSFVFVCLQRQHLRVWWKLWRFLGLLCTISRAIYRFLMFTRIFDWISVYIVSWKNQIWIMFFLIIFCRNIG